MSDEDTQEVEATSPADPTAAESQPEEQSMEVSQETSSATSEQQSEVQDSKPESKPVPRRSAQYRIQQLVEENNRLKNAVSTKEPEVDDWGNEIRPEEKPDIQKLVSEAVQQALKPVMNEHTRTADDSEINEFFSGEKASERPKYEGRIREMWNLPQYKEVAASDLYKIASFDDAVKAASERAIAEYKEAEKQAKESSASGSSNTSNRTGKSGPVSMSDEELLAHNERVKAGIK